LIESKLRNLVVSGYGSTVGKEGKLVYVKNEDGKYTFSPKELEQLILFGEGKITIGAVRYLKREEVDVVFIDERHDQFLRVIDGNNNPIKNLWEKQLTLIPEKKLKIAKEIIEASIYNKIRLLNQFDIKDNKMETRRGDVKKAKSKNQLRGIEGESSRLYFSHFRDILCDKFEFDRRERYPPPDPVNSMLSYGYTVLNSRIQYSLLRAGLNPFLGVLHESYKDKAALTYDLVEPFRSVIVDRIVLTMLHRNILNENDFDYPEEYVCYIKGEGKQAYLNHLFKRLESEYSYNGEKREFLDILFLQADELSEEISGGETFKAFRWR